MAEEIENKAAETEVKQAADKPETGKKLYFLPPSFFRMPENFFFPRLLSLKNVLNCLV